MIQAVDGRDCSDELGAISQALETLRHQALDKAKSDAG